MFPFSSIIIWVLPSFKVILLPAPTASTTSFLEVTIPLSGWSTPFTDNPFGGGTLPDPIEVPPLLNVFNLVLSFNLIAP
ncbi:MAG: hypothetical protein ABI288_02645 [Ginsengibacter sp.]